MEYNIPLFKLNFSDEELIAVTDTINSKWISIGPRCEELETKFKEALDVKHAISLSNCTDALHLAMILNGVSAGDEVICPSLTFAASVNCIKYVGAVPVFCDIEGYDNFNIGPEQIEKLITPKTKAIVVVHMAGFPADMNAIMDLARKYNLKIIEDACHGPLSEYDGKKLGTIGDVGCFSFFSNKNISTGEGGMLVTNNDAIAAKCKLLRSHGMTTMSYQRASGHATSYDVVELGYNYRMDDIRASIGIVQLKKLRSDLEARASIREKYLNMLRDIEDVIIPFHAHQGFVSNYIMPIVLRNSNVEIRDGIRSYLHQRGIQTSVHYPAVHRFSIYKQHYAQLPVTEYVSDNEITLPMFASLTDGELNYITTSLKDAAAHFFNK
jgi:dTDP-4-amino-4,6-dideoxygalactose transaminase